MVVPGTLGVVKPAWLLAMITAIAPASRAIFALIENEHVPRRMTAMAPAKVSAGYAAQPSLGPSMPALAPVPGISTQGVLAGNRRRRSHAARARSQRHGRQCGRYGARAGHVEEEVEALAAMLCGGGRRHPRLVVAERAGAGAGVAGRSGDVDTGVDGIEERQRHRFRPRARATADRVVDHVHAIGDGLVDRQTATTGSGTGPGPWRCSCSRCRRR